jgi:LEA14-like dessication related protein
LQLGLAMKRNLPYATVLVWAIALSGCNSLGNLNVINPTYSLRSVNPRLNLGIPPSIDFDLTVGVDNPNPVSLRLDHLDFDLLINNNAVLRNVRSDQGIHIPARGIGDVRLRTHVTYDDIRTIYREIQDVVQGNRANYAIRGNAYYDTPVGQLRFPVTVNSSR